MTQDVGCIINTQVGCCESGSFDRVFALHWHVVLGPGYCRVGLKRMINRARDVQTLVDDPKNNVGRSKRDVKWHYIIHNVRRRTIHILMSYTVTFNYEGYVEGDCWI